MHNSLLPSIIEAVGGIISAVLAALIAAGYIGKIVRRDLAPHFYAYSDKSHNAHKLFMKKARKSIYIVVSIGDRFLEKFEKHLRSYMDNGVKIYYLLHTDFRFKELESYLGVNSEQGSNTVDLDALRANTLMKLQKIKEDYYEMIEIRECDLFFSASYIAVDIEKGLSLKKLSKDSMIQVMIYQYHTDAGKSPIMYFSPKSSWPQFKKTAICIKSMWEIGRPITFTPEKEA